MKAKKCKNLARLRRNERVRAARFAWMYGTTVFKLAAHQAADLRYARQGRYGIQTPGGVTARIVGEVQNTHPHTVILRQADAIARLQHRIFHNAI